MQLLTLGAGAVTIGGEQGTMRQGQGNAISINGGRPTSNNYTLGLVNTDNSLITPAVILSQDAIQESLGIVWKTPYRVDATTALKPGANTLEIKVTNGWANRIIGDRQPNSTRTYTFTSPKFYKADAPSQPYGLLGPVRLLSASLKA